MTGKLKNRHLQSREKRQPNFIDLKQNAKSHNSKEIGLMSKVVDPKFLLERGRPKLVVGFWMQIQNFHVDFPGGPRIFHVGFVNGHTVRVFQVSLGSGFRFD